MMVECAEGRKLIFGWRICTLALVGAILAIIIAANSHLVAVAISSQPECVPHIRLNDGDGRYQAARSAC